MQPSVDAEARAKFGPSFPRGLAVGVSPEDENSTEKEESQNWQAPALDGSTASHCKQVLVTG
jgi:hypothetical protein